MRCFVKPKIVKIRLLVAKKMIVKIGVDHFELEILARKWSVPILTIIFSATNDWIFTIFGLTEHLIKENSNIKNFFCTYLGYRIISQLEIGSGSARNRLMRSPNVGYVRGLEGSSYISLIAIQISKLFLEVREHPSL